MAGSTPYGDQVGIRSIMPFTLVASFRHYLFNAMSFRGMCGSGSLFEKFVLSSGLALKSHPGMNLAQEDEMASDVSIGEPRRGSIEILMAPRREPHRG